MFKQQQNGLLSLVIRNMGLTYPGSDSDAVTVSNKLELSVEVSISKLITILHITLGTIPYFS